MELSHMLPFATLAADNVVLDLMHRVEKQITLIQFTKRNQSGWVVRSHENTLNTNLKHLALGPAKSPSKPDQEPVNIPHDTMTGAGPAACHISAIYLGKGSLQSISKAPSARKSKNSNNTILSVAASHRNQNQLQSGKGRQFQEVSRNPLQKQDELVERLRQYKIQEQQSNMVRKKTSQRKQAVCKLQKGEAIVFDFDGGFSKRKDKNAKQFNYNHNLQVSPSRDQDLPKKREFSDNVSTNKEGTIVLPQKLELRRERDRERESETSDKEIVFSTNNKKDQILESIQLKNPGVKITVDGQSPKKNKTNLNSENSRASQKVKTVQIKRNSLESNQRFKTEVTMENIGSNRELPSTKRPSAEKKRRVETQASHYSHAKTQKISVQNYLLRKMVLESQEDIEKSYVRIPSKHKSSKRVKTNTDSQVIKQSTEMDSLKIREKLESMIREGDRLPRILSHYKRAESQILKDMRKRFA